MIKTDANGNEQWSQTFGGSSLDYGESVQQTSDGGYIIAGVTNSYGAGESDVYLIKVGGEIVVPPVELIDVDVKDNYMAETDEEKRTIFQRIYDAVVSPLPGNNPEDYISTDVDIILTLSNSDLISSVSGHIVPIDNTTVIGADHEFELNQNDNYELHYISVNASNLLIDLFMNLIVSFVKGTGGTPPISFAAPTMKLETLTVELISGDILTIEVEEILPRFDVALNNQIIDFRDIGLFSGYSGLHAASPVDLLIENNQGLQLGTENGQTFYDIPYSIYSGDTEPEVIMVFGDDLYNTNLDATAAGSYDLTIDQNVVNSGSDGLEVFFDDVSIISTSSSTIEVGLELGEDDYLLFMDYTGTGTVIDTIPPTSITSNLTAYFTADSTEGFAPLTVNFNDLSLGNPVSWAWDVDGDEVIDYTEDNPTHIYQSPGYYTVSLTVADENDSTNTETRVDFITVFPDEPPAAPGNLSIEIVGNSAVLTWDVVDTTIYGNPITVNAYIIYYSELAYPPDSLCYYLSTTTDTSFVHEGIVLSADNLFYMVDAYVGEIDILSGLTSSGELIRREDVNSILNH